MLKPDGYDAEFSIVDWMRARRLSLIFAKALSFVMVRWADE
jgi:hypothetical protein